MEIFQYGMAKDVLRALLRKDLCRSDIDLFTNVLRKAVCDFQGDFAQFSYMTSVRHRDLKDEIRKERPSGAEVNRLAGLLKKETVRQSKFGVSLLFPPLRRLFLVGNKHRVSQRPPRLSVKVNLPSDEDSSDKRIGEMARDGEANYSKPCFVHENTGFSEVEKGGTYYLCNDIPRAAKAGRYVNPRLISEKVERYKIPGSKWDRIRRNKLGRKLGLNVGCKEDLEWVDCWQRVNICHKAAAPPVDSCYKSTLIVPMTLRGHVNRADDVFSGQFGLTDADRAIFGYLCLDHPCVDYFFDVRDVNVCYMFSDLMSFYLMTLINYMGKSNTYSAASRFANMAG